MAVIKTGRGSHSWTEREHNKMMELINDQEPPRKIVAELKKISPFRSSASIHRRRNLIQSGESARVADNDKHDQYLSEIRYKWDDQQQRAVKLSTQQSQSTTRKFDVNDTKTSDDTSFTLKFHGTMAQWQQLINNQNQ